MTGRRSVVHERRHVRQRSRESKRVLQITCQLVHRHFLPATARLSASEARRAGRDGRAAPAEQSSSGGQCATTAPSACSTFPRLTSERPFPPVLGQGCAVSSP